MLFIVASASTLASTRLLRSRTVESDSKRKRFLYATDNRVGGEKEICISLQQNENPIHWLLTPYMTFEQQNPQHTLKYKAHHTIGTSQSWIHPW
jgi:hypothetical protein